MYSTGLSSKIPWSHLRWFFASLQYFHLRLFLTRSPFPPIFLKPSIFIEYLEVIFQRSFFPDSLSNCRSPGTRPRIPKPHTETMTCLAGNRAKNPEYSPLQILRPYIRLISPPQGCYLLIFFVHLHWFSEKADIACFSWL